MTFGKIPKPLQALVSLSIKLKLSPRVDGVDGIGGIICNKCLEQCLAPGKHPVSPFPLGCSEVHMGCPREVCRQRIKQSNTLLLAVQNTSEGSWISVKTPLPTENQRGQNACSAHFPVSRHESQMSTCWYEVRDRRGRERELLPRAGEVWVGTSSVRLIALS